MADAQELIAADQRAREQALDIGRSYIVQAPAGSGKTELLIQRFLCVLDTCDQPEEVRAITFTRKAAAEMQVRVLQALRAATEDQEPTADYERVTRAAALKVLNRDKRHGWNLLQNPGRLRIQTMDALNAAVARNQPLTTTGGATGTAIVADAEMRALYEEAALLTLDQLADGESYSEATTRVLGHLDNNSWLYVAYLSRMLATRDQWLPFIASGIAGQGSQLREQLESNLQRLVSSALAAVAEEFPPKFTAALLDSLQFAANHLPDKLADDHPLRKLTAVDRIPPADAGYRDQWLGLAELLLTADGRWRKRLTVNNGFPAAEKNAKQQALELIESLAAVPGLNVRLRAVRSLPPCTYSDSQWAVLESLFQLLPLAATELKRLFSLRSVADHIEVALDAAGALGTADAPGEGALLLDYQIRHLLVDEMQDTSLAQYRMLEALTGGWQPGDGRTLFCVGDPMQSIYRFRNAEVGQFLLAMRFGIGSVDLEPLTLRRNFRSGSGLVDWFNAVFPDVLARRNDARSSAVAYEAAVSVPQLDGIGSCEVHPVIGADSATESKVSLAIIEHTLMTHQEDDVAVLVRSRTHLASLLARLRTSGIAYRAVEIDRLTDLPEIIDILALTRALVHAGDRVAWLALLRAPWVGMTLTDLHALVVGNRDSTVWELLTKPECVARLSDDGRQRATRFVAQMRAVRRIDRSLSLRDRLESAWLQFGGAAAVPGAEEINNVYRFLDIVEGMEVAGTLPDVATLESALDVEHVSSDAPARLQVMTIHRAKGLQFDHVLLHGLGRIPRPPEPEVLSWFDVPMEEGPALKVISPIGQRANVEKDPLHRFIAQTDREKDRNELARLLYVACTRARKSLHIIGHANRLKAGLAADPRSLLRLLWPAVGADFESAADSLDDTGSNDEEATFCEPQLRRFTGPWKAPEIELETAVIETTSAEDAAVEFYWVGSQARVAGTLVHRWLQLLQDDLDSWPDSTRIESTTRRWLRQGGSAASDDDFVTRRVAAALGSVRDDPKGRWLLASGGFRELGLTGVIGGVRRSLVLDRVRIDDDGTHWVVDYKTSTHEGGRLDEFLAAEADRYRQQLRDYAEVYRAFSGAPVRTALYFPLLQKFVEVAVD